MSFVQFSTVLIKKKTYFKTPLNLLKSKKNPPSETYLENEITTTFLLIDLKLFILCVY
jgi:hypothetical protein